MLTPMLYKFWGGNGTSAELSVPLSATQCHLVTASVPLGATECHVTVSVPLGATECRSVSLCDSECATWCHSVSLEVTLHLKWHQVAPSGTIKIYPGCTLSEDINTDSGIDFILEALRRPLMTRTIYLKRRYLHDFENIQGSRHRASKAIAIAIIELSDRWRASASR